MAQSKKKRNLDLLTLAYDLSGKAYRNSPIGRATKFAITNDLTKRARNLLIDKENQNIINVTDY